MQTAQPPVNFINVSYFFQLIYNLVFSGHLPSLNGLEGFAEVIWIWVTILSFLASIFMIGVIIYYSLRLYQVVEEEDKKFSTISKDESHTQVEHARWAYVMQLIESTQESDWRTAIIEADIMLDELLSKLGYQGASVGDKLKQANQSHFHSLNDAWSAHNVRNEIAHQGSAYQLSDHLAYRTIHQFENVFREFHEI